MSEEERTHSVRIPELIAEHEAGECRQKHRQHVGAANASREGAELDQDTSRLSRMILKLVLSKQAA